MAVKFQRTLVVSTFCALVVIVTQARAVCPYNSVGTPPTHNATVPELTTYNEELADLDVAAVFEDIQALLTDSQDCWPADTFNGVSSYGPFFIRLAWHCSGSYREHDGIGGCTGGRQRFPPEASWEDNTNLDKARALLVPIKEKYGDALSYGDLFVFAGTASIMAMGGPVSEICYGRVDDADGTASLPLTNTSACPVEGDCPLPMGASTLGLIYVNPEGVQAVPDPATSAERIRDVFGRMDMNDTETVALIGGGHAFGKAHGACPDGAGPGPEDQPNNPWPGLCSEGVYTSGLEGQWTADPLSWDNEFFVQLLENNYTLITGDGDKQQWKNDANGLMMFTTDLALIYDADYKAIVKSYAEDLEVLNTAFAAAWAKLTTNGGKWAANKQCVDASELFASTDSSTGTKGLDAVSSNVWLALVIVFFMTTVIFLALWLRARKASAADTEKANIPLIKR